MTGAALALLLVAAAAGEQPSAPDALQEALECRAYTDMALAVYAGDVGMATMTRRLHRYWVARGDELGRKQKLSKEVLEMKQLLIPLTAERFKEVMKRCLDATPRKALR